MFSPVLLLIFSGQALLLGRQASSRLNALPLMAPIALLLTGMASWLVVEGLGAFGQLTAPNIVRSLAGLTGLSVACAWRAGYYRGLRGHSVQLTLTAWEWALAAVGLLLFALALYSPPNNWDAQIYHLPRIFHWLAQKSVAHFPTPQLGQIAFPPLSSFFTLILFAHSGSDAFFNLVQFSCLLFSAANIYLCAKLLGQTGITALIFALTIPMAILQATSAQNDLVVSAFLTSALVAAILFQKRGQPAILGLFFVLLALGCLVKGTFLLFGGALFLCLFASQPKPFLSAFRTRALALSLALSFLFLLPHHLRNFRASGKAIVSAGSLVSYSGQTIAEVPLAALVQMSKNILNEFDLLDQLTNGQFGEISGNILRYLSSATDDSGMNVAGAHFQTVAKVIPDEDYAGATLQTLLALVAFAGFGIGILRKKNSLQASDWLLYTFPFLALLLFSACIRWQIWNNRLLMPLLLCAAPGTAVFLERKIPRILLRPIFVLLCAYSLFFVFFNRARPIFGSRLAPPIYTSSRFENLFRNRPDLLPSAHDLEQRLLHQCPAGSSVQIKLSATAWEYPLWAISLANERDYSFHSQAKSGDCAVVETCGSQELYCLR